MRHAKAISQCYAGGISYYECCQYPRAFLGFLLPFLSEGLHMYGSCMIASQCGLGCTAEQLALTCVRRLRLQHQEGAEREAGIAVLEASEHVGMLARAFIPPLHFYFYFYFYLFYTAIQTHCQVEESRCSSSSFAQQQAYKLLSRGRLQTLVSSQSQHGRMSWQVMTLCSLDSHKAQASAVQSLNSAPHHLHCNMSDPLGVLTVFCANLDLYNAGLPSACRSTLVTLSQADA